MWQLRTGDQLVGRYQRAGDPLGWEKEIIARYMTEAEAEAVGAVAGRAQAKEYTIENVLADALAYLDYAYGEALRHRNVEAQRSVYKLDYWLWLLGQDERLVLAHGERGLYGANALRLAGEMLGRPEFPPTRFREFEDKKSIPMPSPLQHRLARMAAGLPCVLMCPDGCLWKREDEE